MKKMKASVVKNLMDEGQLPHPITYYFDLFNVAQSLLFSVTGRAANNKPPSFYKEQLETDFPKFFALVVKAHKEKHGDKKYSAEISLESALLDVNSDKENEEMEVEEAPKRVLKSALKKEKVVETAPVILYRGAYVS